jgi:hypothetical protein
VTVQCRGPVHEFRELMMGTQRLQMRFMQEGVVAVVSFVELKNRASGSLVWTGKLAWRPIEGLQALFAIALQQNPPEDDPGIGVPESVFRGRFGEVTRACPGFEIRFDGQQLMLLCS